MHEPAANDLYAVLGVARDAPAREIHRAYRRLARQHHPDLNQRPEGSEQFVRLAHAYEILHDPAQRARYDRSLLQGAVASGPLGLHDGPAPSTAPRVRYGILELSHAEALHVAHYPMALHNAQGHTILLPAGTRHGDQMSVPEGAYKAVLTIQTPQKDLTVPD